MERENTVHIYVTNHSKKNCFFIGGLFCQIIYA